MVNRNRKEINMSLINYVNKQAGGRDTVGVILFENTTTDDDVRIANLLKSDDLECLAKKFKFKILYIGNVLRIKYNSWTLNLDHAYETEFFDLFKSLCVNSGIALSKVTYV
jgi:hypothetical protein